MVPAMQALCIFGVIRSVNGTMGSFFQGIGKPYVNTVASSIQLVLLAIIILPLAMRWYILGVAIAVIAPNVLALVYLGKKLLSVTNYRFIYVAKFLFFPIAATAVMSFVMLSVHACGGKTLGKFFISIPLGIGTYLGTMFLIDKISNFSLRNNIVSAIKAL